MIPTPGRIVEYTLTESDAEQINRRNKDANDNRRNHQDAALGYIAHIGNGAHELETYPMVIVRCWGNTEGSSVNGQVLLDGNHTLWVTSVAEGDGPRTWRAYPRV